MGIVARFSPKYITAMSAGQALGGIFTALTEILSLWVGASPVISGLLYFIIGDIVLFLSLIAYIILEREASLRLVLFYQDKSLNNFKEQGTAFSIKNIKLHFLLGFLQTSRGYKNSRSR